MLPRRSLLALAPTLLAPALLERPALAAGWPERSLRLIVPVAAGGSQDIVGRLLARHLTEALGQSVLVENAPGAGSNIGYEAASRARPDGYTLLAGSDSLSINKVLFPRLGFDVTGFAPVSRSVKVPQIFVVRADHPAQSFAEWVEMARRQPMAVGTPGNGSLAHLLGEVVQAAAEIRWTHAPYRGGALAVNDLMGGSLQGVMINIGAVTDHVRGGRLRGLAVSPARRTLALPQVPTLQEQGFSGVDVVGWHGLVAPPGTDPALCLRLHGEVAKLLARPDVAERVLALGMEAGSETPAELGDLILADARRWGEVVRRARIEPD